MASLLLLLTATAVLWFTLTAPKPLPDQKRQTAAPRALHRVQFRHTLGLVGWLVRFLPYEARQVTQADMRAHVKAMTIGTPPHVAAAALARVVFVRRWWHVGPLAPARQFLRLPLPMIPALLEALMQVPPTRRG